MHGFICGLQANVAILSNNLMLLNYDALQMLSDHGGMLCLEPFRSISF